jgi:hypothetical protein
MVNWDIISCGNVTEVKSGPHLARSVIQNWLPLCHCAVVPLGRCAIVPLCHQQREEELEINKNTIILII